MGRQRRWRVVRIMLTRSALPAMRTGRWPAAGLATPHGFCCGSSQLLTSRDDGGCVRCLRLPDSILFVGPPLRLAYTTVLASLLLGRLHVVDQPAHASDQQHASAYTSEPHQSGHCLSRRLSIMVKSLPVTNSVAPTERRWSRKSLPGRAAFIWHTIDQWHHMAHPSKSYSRHNAVSWLPGLLGGGPTSFRRPAALPLLR